MNAMTVTILTTPQCDEDNDGNESEGSVLTDHGNGLGSKAS